MKSLVRVFGFWLILGAGIIAHLALEARFGIQKLEIISPSIAALAGLCVAVLERWMPARPEWQASWRDLTMDGVYTWFILPGVARAVDVSVQALVFFVVTSQGATLNLWPDSWPFALQVVFALLFADLMFYLVHRALHEIPFFWRFHSIHHSVDKVYWLNSGHFHPVDTALTSAFFIGSLHFLGVPERVLGLFWTINMVHGYLEHANVDFRLGWGNRIWNTPELHQWHHSELIVESNKNYGKVFSIWDGVFRSWYLPLGKRVARAGLTGDLPPKYNIWAQFMFAFRRKFT